MRHLIAVCVLATATLGGCAHGTKFEMDDARKVTVGMTEADLTKLLGRPYRMTVRADGGVIWQWIQVNVMTGFNQSLTIPMRDGRVVSAPVIPDSFK